MFQGRPGLTLYPNGLRVTLLDCVLQSKICEDWHSKISLYVSFSGVDDARPSLRLH